MRVSTCVQTACFAVEQELVRPDQVARGHRESAGGERLQPASKESFERESGSAKWQPGESMARTSGPFRARKRVASRILNRCRPPGLAFLGLRSASRLRYLRHSAKSAVSKNGYVCAAILLPGGKSPISCSERQESQRERRPRLARLLFPATVGDRGASQRPCRCRCSPSSLRSWSGGTG